MKQYGFRLIRVVFGLFLYGLGMALTVQANVGLAPWEAFSAGVSLHIDVSMGTVVILSGAVILIFDILLKEKIGLGTILNTFLIGAFVDLIQALNVIPLCSSLLPGIGMLLLGQITLCLGSFFYISPGLGCGPRDSLMVALGKRFKKIPIGAVRGGIEASVLLIGWLLGAKVGIGTVISVFGISFILQWTFKLLKFDVKAVAHESLLDTGARLTRLFAHQSDAAEEDR